MRILPALLFSSALLLSSTAHAQMMAQQGQPSFDQYPSFIEMSANAQGVQSVLRCGYTSVAAQIAPDPGYHEVTSLNQGNGAYLRLQRIDDRVIATTASTTGNGRFVLELMGPGGIIAKDCNNDPGSDTIQNCVAAQPFMSGADMMAQDQNVGTQCNTFLAKSLSQNALNASVYDAQKTQAFKARLREKIAILEAP